MARIAGFFIFVCMITIAASLGVVLHLRFGFDIGSAASVAMSVLVLLVVIHFQSLRHRDRGFVVRRTNEVGDRLHAASQELASIETRLAGFEDGLPHRTREELEPVVAEIEVLGTLVKQLAETMSEFEVKVQDLSVRAVPRPPPSPQIRSSDPAGSNPTPAAGNHPGAADNRQLTETIRQAVEASRIDLFLQPVVTLPQRKTRYYEALTRLRAADGELIMPADYIPIAEQAGIMPSIDNVLVLRAVQIVRRMSSRNRKIGVFCNMSPASLIDAGFFDNVVEFLEKNSELSDSVFLEFSQQTMRDLGPVEVESLGALRDLGFGFSVDQVGDLNIEFDALADLGVRFLKVPADLMLTNADGIGGAIHTADLAKMLDRYGVTLIVDHIETETQVVDVLDYDVTLGQGFLFSPPRPVRAEVITGTGAPPAAAVG